MAWQKLQRYHKRLCNCPNVMTGIGHGALSSISEAPSTPAPSAANSSAVSLPNVSPAFPGYPGYPPMHSAYAYPPGYAPSYPPLGYHMQGPAHPIMYTMPPPSPGLHRSRKCQHSNDFSSYPFEEPPTPHLVEYPRIEQWLLDIECDNDRNIDRIAYSQLTNILVQQGVIRLDNLADLAQVNVGTTGHILAWVAADKSRVEGNGHRHKHRHYGY